MKMMKFAALTAAGLLMTAFASCSKDEAPGGSHVDKDMVSTDLPRPGFSGDKNNGILYYAENDLDTEDGAPYLAFKMKDGVVDQAAVNVVFDSAAEAKRIADMMNKGFSDAEEDDDWDDIENDPFWRPAQVNAANQQVLSAIPSVKRLLGKSTRAKNDLFVIPVSVNGCVIYAGLPAFKGVGYDDLVEYMQFLDNGYGTIDHVIFGTYKDNHYECKGLMGLNMNIYVDTDYNSKGFCTKFETTIDCPSKAWAQTLYDTMQEGADQIEEAFGARPEITISGSKVTEKAIILGDVPREFVDRVIYGYDWALNVPMLYVMFE